MIFGAAFGRSAFLTAPENSLLSAPLTNLVIVPLFDAALAPVPTPAAPGMKGVRNLATQYATLYQAPDWSGPRRVL